MTVSLVSCAACDPTSNDSIFGGLLRCRHCGHAFAPPGATEEDLAAIYTESYFAGEEYHDYLADKHVAQRNFRSRLRVLKKFINQPSPAPLRSRMCLRILS